VDAPAEGAWLAGALPVRRIQINRPEPYAVTRAPWKSGKFPDQSR